MATDEIKKCEFGTRLATIDIKSKENIEHKTVVKKSAGDEIFTKSFLQNLEDTSIENLDMFAKHE